MSESGMIIIATAVMSTGAIAALREGFKRQRMMREAGLNTKLEQPFRVETYRRLQALQLTPAWRASMRRHFAASLLMAPAAIVMLYLAYRMLVS